MVKIDHSFSNAQVKKNLSQAKPFIQQHWPHLQLGVLLLTWFNFNSGMDK